MDSRGDTALITGISGFVGQHLARHLLGLGYEIHGTVRPGAPGFSLLAPAEIKRLNLHAVDLIDAHGVERAVKSFAPSVIFHLAGQAFVPESLRDPAATYLTNVVGTANLIEAVRRTHGPLRMLISGSAEVYGLVSPDKIPLSEQAPFNPVSPYAASKVSQYYVGLAAWHSYGFPVVYATAFNHIGPGQGDRFVVSSFARQLAEMRLGIREPVMIVGNLDSQRDFTDVRDVVRAYQLLAQLGTAGEAYNVCSGRSQTIASVVEEMIGVAGVSPQRRQDPQRMRPSDLPLLRGDYRKLREATGWQPEIPLATSLRDALAFWQERLAVAQYCKG